MRRPSPITESEIVAILNALADGTWKKGPSLARMCGVTERTIRRVAEETAGLISGNDGYKRVDLATKAELARNVASLRSRARKLMARADEISCRL